MRAKGELDGRRLSMRGGREGLRAESEAGAARSTDTSWQVKAILTKLTAARVHSASLRSTKQYAYLPFRKNQPLLLQLLQLRARRRRKPPSQIVERRVSPAHLDPPEPTRKLPNQGLAKQLPFDPQDLTRGAPRDKVLELDNADVELLEVRNESGLDELRGEAVGRSAGVVCWRTDDEGG